MGLTDALLDGGTRDDAKGVCLPWAPLPTMADGFGPASRLAERGAVIGEDLAGGLATAVFGDAGLAEWFAGLTILTMVFDFAAATVFFAGLADVLTGGLAERAGAGPVLVVPDRTGGFDLRRLAVRLAGRLETAAFAATLRFGEPPAPPPGVAALPRRRVSFAMF